MNMEKVVKGLEACIDRKPGEYTCNNCPYENDGNDCDVNMSKDALFMLKKQDAEIRQLRLALDIVKGACEGIRVEGR